MQLKHILSPERTLLFDCGSKKRLFESTAHLAAEQVPGLEEEVVFEKLIARERLGSTSLGGGVALPHCRVPHCREVVGILSKVSPAIDFDAGDTEPVDLVFVLLVPLEPTEEHLRTLAMLADYFSRDEFKARLRQSADRAALYGAAVDYRPEAP